MASLSRQKSVKQKIQKHTIVIGIQSSIYYGAKFHLKRLKIEQLV